MVCPKLSKYKTLNFKSKSYEQIFLETLQDSVTENLISEDTNLLNYVTNNEDIENQYILQASIHSKQIEKVYDEINNIYDAQNIETAIGEDLNRIGLQLGFNRPAPTQSYTSLTFTINGNNENTIIIPQNTLISTRKNGGKNYRTLESGKILKGNNNVTVPAISIDYGANSRVEAGELTYIQKHINNSTTDNLQVTNTEASTGGNNPLTDDEYREVLKQWSTILEKGTLASYKYYLDNFEGLESYNLIGGWDGAGTIKLVISPNSQYLVDQLSTELYENIQLFDEDVIIVGANEQTIDISMVVNITLDSTREYTSTEVDNLKSEITELVSLYIDGGTLCNTEYISPMGIGEDFIPFKLARFITSRIPIIQDVSFDDNTPIRVDEESRATTGTVTVTIN